MRIKDGVKHYFDKIPDEWDRLYSDKIRFWGNLNRYLRKGLFERYELTFKHCGEIAGARVLDIGCGTGQYSIEFARRGAAQVVGIDFAPSMIAFAQESAQKNQVSEYCDFICADFLSHNFQERFDIVVALGFFDYIQDPQSYFKKISSLTKRRFLASFLKDSLIWGTQKKIRYHWIKKCPIYFSTFEGLVSLYNQANFAGNQIISTSNGFFGIGINSA